MVADFLGHPLYNMTAMILHLFSLLLPRVRPILVSNDHEPTLPTKSPKVIAATLYLYFVHRLSSSPKGVNASRRQLAIARKIVSAVNMVATKPQRR